jgi:hypothetical protein
MDGARRRAPSIHAEKILETRQVWMNAASVRPDYRDYSRFLRFNYLDKT